MLALASIYFSNVTQLFFSPRDAAVKMRQAGRIVDQATADNSVAVVVDDYGIMSPIFLYLRPPEGLELRADGRVAVGRSKSPAARCTVFRHHALAGVPERQARNGVIPGAVSGRPNWRRACRDAFDRFEAEKGWIP